MRARRTPLRQVMGFHVVRADELEWEEYTNYPGRHRAAVTDGAALRHTRANFIRHEAGAIGPRHVERVQDETVVPVRGTLTMYLGDPPERHDVETGGLVHVESGTPLQIANHGDEELRLYIYGAPPEQGKGEFLDSVL
jgi:mannose-6-phosphate isomerase-like protein (cupin superfamily)